jgi:hypothetical protein
MVDRDLGLEKSIGMLQRQIVAGWVIWAVMACRRRLVAASRSSRIGGE